MSFAKIGTQARITEEDIMALPDEGGCLVVARAGYVGPVQDCIIQLRGQEFASRVRVILPYKIGVFRRHGWRIIHHRVAA